MSDGYANGPYRPISDSDIMSNSDVGGVLGMLKPPYGDRVARHMMAVERKIARVGEDLAKKAVVALAELVACKDLKERMESLKHGDARYPALKAEYESRKTAAWATARTLVDPPKNAPQL